MLVQNYEEVHCVGFHLISYVSDSSHVLVQITLLTIEICGLNNWSALCLLIRHYCDKCAHEPYVQSILGVVHPFRYVYAMISF